MIIEGLKEAIRLIITGNPEVIDITLRSLYVSSLAIAFALSWSFPIAIFVGLKNFFGKNIIKSIFNALIGIPTVALGLILYFIFSRSGALGAFHLLYTSLAISIGQAILVTPILVSFITNYIEAVPKEKKELALTLGANKYQVPIVVLKDARIGIVLAIIASFNRAIAELGIALMVGGNIANMTRVMTTTISLETARGETALAIALTIILLLIVFSITFIANLLQRVK
ncbi:MAG: ABC transporter permease [Candidatus Thermoplasmatota archaeon]